ncbi:MAG: alpha-galactosidase [Muribaculaceae bacterium]|nr:alpha-galactosidase [Muribaculaceae bacterium]
MKLKNLAFLLPLVAMTANAEDIVISTNSNALVYNVADNGRVYQKYFGKKLKNPSDYATIPNGQEIYITSGMEDYYEPALHIVHADGNPSTLLTYKGHKTSTLADGAQQTVISLTDNKYNDNVDVYYIAYPEHDIIKTYTTITNGEKKPIKLEKYASSILHFNNGDYYLTQYNGDWASEATATETKLEYGRKQLDTKLGARANMFCSPFFQLGIDSPASENEGELLAGTLGWTGNFRFTFEVDQNGELRVISGINPYASTRTLKSGETFTTPEFIFTLSDAGRGKASRNFHDWARDHQIYKGNDTRMTLLNNWEATYFDFDEEKLIKLIGEAKDLGVDMFLLDDGWFGNKYPRHSDTQGLGDWDETKNKLPNGIGALTEAAKKNGVKFGLWIEPEMVNPKSELYEKHKDWVITLPNRDEYYFRNQLVLDLSNPKVQDFVFNVVDELKTKYPDIAFFKWDCNSPITNIYSNYLGNNQDHLYVDYVKGLYNVLERIQKKYPDLIMMMCSGGGGRSDYEGLKYFTEFWPSDNTDPLERLYIQWGFSQFFPAKTLCSHVTTWNRSTPVKFRTNVAMMGKLGFDLKLDDLTKEEAAYCRQAIKNYNALKPIILEGDQYRLVSPYEGPHAATMYVGKNDGNAVVFAFDVNPRYRQSISKSEANVKLEGLNPDARYVVTEIDRMDGKDVKIGEYSGDYLMTIGLPLFTLNRLTSRVYTVNKI